MENLDKTTRSIFVGNIPYEATEEKLIMLFSQAGPVIGFRLVYDRESGKPKGYGFCEYNSPAVAASALRNLDNIDYNGRPLRIGPAAGEQNSAEVAMTNNTTMKPPQESPYGEKVDPQQSDVAISQAVASLPPEQLFDLMQQMKQCIQINPNEARQLLLQNPQLAYALLQAQIIMKIVEPKVAIAMLTRSNEQIPQTTTEQPQNHPTPNVQQPQQMFQNQQYPPNVDHLQHNANGIGPNPNMFRQGMQLHMPHNMVMSSQMSQMPQMPAQISSQMQPQMQSQMQPQMQPQMQQQMGQQFIPFPGPQMNNNFCPPPIFSGHQGGPSDPAIRDIKPEMTTTRQQEAVATEMMNYLGRTGEKEKAALIMQVLNLSDEEVAKLPDDQRLSIEVLKSQLKKN